MRVCAGESERVFVRVRVFVCAGGSDVCVCVGARMFGREIVLHALEVRVLCVRCLEAWCDGRKRA